MTYVFFTGDYRKHIFMKHTKTKSVDTIYKNGVLMLDTLAKQKLISKQSIMFYRDYQSNSVIFGLAVPSWQRMPIANGTLIYVHLDRQPVQKIQGKHDYQLESNLFVQVVLSGYYNSVVNSLAELSSQIQTNQDRMITKDIAKDYTYILQCYLNDCQKWPKLKQIADPAESLSYNLLKDMHQKGALNDNNWQLVKSSGNFLAIYIGNLINLIADNNHSLDEIINVLRHTKIKTPTVKTNKAGFCLATLKDLAGQ